MSEHRTFHMIEAVADRLEGAPRQVMVRTALLLCGIERAAFDHCAGVVVDGCVVEGCVDGAVVDGSVVEGVVVDGCVVVEGSVVDG